MHGLLRSFASISYSLLGSSTGPNVDIEWQRLDNRQISPEEDAATAAQQGREVITSFMAEQLVQSRTQDNNNTLDTLVQPFLQMGPYGILQETDTVIPALLTEAGNDEETRLDWTSGYFSVRKSCRQALINTPGPVRIVCAAPEVCRSWSFFRAVVEYTDVPTTSLTAFISPLAFLNIYPQHTPT